MKPGDLAQKDAQIGLAVAANGTAINLERAQDTDKTSIDLLLGSVGKQYCWQQLAPGQTAAEGFAHHVRVAAQSLAMVLATPRHRIKVLIPEKGEPDRR